MLPGNIVVTAPPLKLGHGDDNTVVKQYGSEDQPSMKIIPTWRPLINTLHVAKSRRTTLYVNAKSRAKVKMYRGATF